jgi:uncharacterized protein (DUF1330 family)
MEQVVNAGETLMVITVHAITDPAAIGRYSAAIGPIIRRHGGRAIAMGRVPVKGHDNDAMVVVQAWPTEQAARNWLDDPEYAPWIAVRDAAARISMVIVPPVAAG